MKLKLLYVLAALPLLIVSCNKDGDSGTDLTIQAKGTYNGTYKESTNGSSVSTDEVLTVVTRQSDTEIKVNINVIPGFAVISFTGEMTGETSFTVPQFTFGDGDLKGSGTLENGNTLKIQLDKVDNAGDKITFEGARQ
jgi:hypothetical protein